MLRVGLTGGIASGKSTVAQVLRVHGVPVVDADQLAREAVAPGTPALAALRAEFGDAIVHPNGALDRTALGALVFENAKARLALNAIVHPAVHALAEARFAALAAAGVPVAVYDVPLLFETGLDALMDKTLLVAAHPETQIARILARDGLDRAAAEARIAAQLPLDDKRRRATVTLQNDGSLEDTVAALKRAWPTLTGHGLGA